MYVVRSYLQSDISSNTWPYIAYMFVIHFKIMQVNSLVSCQKLWHLAKLRTVIWCVHRRSVTDALIVYNLEFF